MSRHLFSASCLVAAAFAHQGGRQQFLQPESAQPVKLSVGQNKAADPKWDGKKVQNEETYTPDLVSDESPAPTNETMVKHEEWPKKGRYTMEPTAENYGEARRWADKSSFARSTATSSDSDDDVFSLGDGTHTMDWYLERCEQIDAQCQAQEDETIKRHQLDLSALEAEYRRQLRILKERQGEHADAEDEVVDQKREVAKHKMKVEDARKAVKENAHCPPELEAAKQKLDELEAEPNETPEDIEAECKQRKIVLEKEACVEVLLAAQEVLDAEKADHSDEKTELKGDKADEADAEAALPPQEKRVADAKAALDAAKARGPQFKKNANEHCQGAKDDLLKQAMADLSALEEEYRRQKAILEGKEADHAEEKEDVAEQKKEVAEEKIKVRKAKIAVKDNAHCPPELEEARAKLAELEAVPNETPEDIEDECKARKVVLEKERCVAVLREAEAFLREKKVDYRDEKHELGGEQVEEDAAADALPPQEKRVADAKAALDAARAGLEALKKCVNGGKDDEEPAPEPETRSGAVHVTIAWMSVGAAIFAGLLNED